MKRLRPAATLASNSVDAADPKRSVADMPARSSYHHGNLRDALVMRGIEILDPQGFEALSLRQAARCRCFAGGAAAPLLQLAESFSA